MINCGSVVTSWRLLRYCTVNSIVMRYVETAVCMCVSACIWHLFVCGCSYTAWFSETATSVTVAPDVQCMKYCRCVLVYICYYGNKFYSFHWIKGARDKVERYKVALEEEVAVRDKQVTELTTELALRNGDLDKKEVRRELLCYNENCHGSCRA